MLVVTLAIFDFIQMFKTPVFIVNSFNEGPIFGKLGCQIYGVLGAYGGVGSSATNAAIAFDRYRFPSKSFQFHFLINNHNSTVAIISILTRMIKNLFEFNLELITIQLKLFQFWLERSKIHLNSIWNEW